MLILAGALNQSIFKMSVYNDAASTISTGAFAFPTRDPIATDPASLGFLSLLAKRTGLSSAAQNVVSDALEPTLTNLRQTIGDLAQSNETCVNNMTSCIKPFSDLARKIVEHFESQRATKTIAVTARYVAIFEVVLNPSVATHTKIAMLLPEMEAVLHNFLPTDLIERKASEFAQWFISLVESVLPSISFDVYSEYQQRALSTTDLISSFSSLAALLGVGSVSRREQASLARDFNALCTTSKNITEMATKFVAIIRFVSSWALEKLGLSDGASVYSRHQFWCDTFNYLAASPDTRQIIVNDKNAAAAFVELYALGRALQIEMANTIYNGKCAFTPQQISGVGNLLKEFQPVERAAASVVANVRLRPNPLPVMLIGAPGIGKSTLVEQISRDFVEGALFYTDRGKVFDYANDVYIANGQSEYFDQYRNQPVFVYDDLFQFRDNQMLLRDLATIFKFEGTLPAPLNAADCAMKGQLFFNSHLFLSTTNSKGVSKDAKDVVVSPEALERRFYLQVRVTLRDKAAVWDPLRDCVDPTKITLLDYVFHVTSNGKPVIPPSGTETHTYYELMAYINVSYIQRQSQQQLDALIGANIIKNEKVVTIPLGQTMLLKSCKEYLARVGLPDVYLQKSDDTEEYESFAPIITRAPAPCAPRVINDIHSNSILCGSIRRDGHEFHEFMYRIENTYYLVARDVCGVLNCNNTQIHTAGSFSDVIKFATIYAWAHRQLEPNRFNACVATIRNPDCSFADPALYFVFKKDLLPPIADIPSVIKDFLVSALGATVEFAQNFLIHFKKICLGTAESIRFKACALYAKGKSLISTNFKELLAKFFAWIVDHCETALAIVGGTTLAVALGNKIYEHLTPPEVYQDGENVDIFTRNGHVTAPLEAFEDPDMVNNLSDVGRALRDIHQSKSALNRVLPEHLHQHYTSSGDPQTRHHSARNGVRPPKPNSGLTQHEYVSRSPTAGNSWARPRRALELLDEDSRDALEDLAAGNHMMANEIGEHVMLASSLIKACGTPVAVRYYLEDEGKDVKSELNGFGIYDQFLLVPRHLFRSFQTATTDLTKYPYGWKEHLPFNGFNADYSEERAQFEREHPGCIVPAYLRSKESSLSIKLHGTTEDVHTNFRILVPEPNEERDFCVVYLPDLKYKFRDMRTHFLRKDHFGRVQTGTAVFNLVATPFCPSTQQPGISTYIGLEFCTDSFSAINSIGKLREYACLWQTRGALEYGMCGSLLITKQNHLPGKILGIATVANDRTGHSFFEYVTFEALQSCIAQVEAEDFLAHQVSLEVPILEPFFEGPRTPLYGHSSDRLRILGTIDREFVSRQPDDSKIYPSLLHGSFPATTAPARLRKIVRDGVIDFPVSRSVYKQYYQPKSFPRNVLRRTLNHLRAYYSQKKFSTKWDGQWQRLDEYTNVRGRHCLTPIVMNTSSGLPWCAQGRLEGMKQLPGKRSFFLQDESGTYIGYSNALRGLVEDLAETAAKTVPVVLCNVGAKDERRTFAKVDEPRTINTLPIEVLVLMRELFGAYCGWINICHLIGDIAVGINVHSVSWTVLANRLLSVKGAKLFGCDHKNFDKQLDGNVQKISLEVMIDWYDLQYDKFQQERFQNQAGTRCEYLPQGARWDKSLWFVEEGREEHERTQQMRRNMFWSCSQALYCDGGVIYETLGGNPSGSCLTVVTNSLTNQALTIAFFIDTFGRAPVPGDFEAVYYGDDALFSVSEPLQEKFNFFTLRDWYKKRNMVITWPSKDGTEKKFCEGIHEADFLKRTWLQQPGGEYYAALSRDVIKEVPQWYHEPNDIRTATLENLENALLEATLHGPDFHAELVSGFSPACRKNQIFTYFFDYDHCFAIYSDRFSNPAAVPTQNDWDTETFAHRFISRWSADSAQKALDNMPRHITVWSPLDKEGACNRKLDFDVDRRPYLRIHGTFQNKTNHPIPPHVMQHLFHCFEDLSTSQDQFWPSSETPLLQEDRTESDCEEDSECESDRDDECSSMASHSGESDPGSYDDRMW